MKILLLHSSSDLYGASKILLGIVHLLKKRNHQVWVVLSEEGPLSSVLAEAGATVMYIRLGILRRKYVTPRGIINRIITIRKAKKQLQVFIIQQGIERVYSNTSGVLAGAFAAAACNVPHIWHVHEIIENPRWFKFLLGKWMTRYAKKIVVVSNAVKQSWQSVIPEHQLVVVHNGIDYSLYITKQAPIIHSEGSDENRFIIGMVGRVHYWKGQSYFIEIAGKLHQRYPYLQFIMVGDAFPGYEYLYKSLSDQIQQLHLQDVVKQMGFRNDIPAIMQSVNLFILPSQLPDPFPTVILEAMASEKPVIATEMGGALEMIDREITGDFIPPNAAEKAADIISKWIDKQKCYSAGKEARKRVLQKFSLENWENNLINIIE